MSKVTPIFRGKILDGKIAVKRNSDFKQYLSRLEGKEVELAVEAARKHRSPQQNAYYWGVALELIAESTGFTPEEIHQVMKKKFLRYGRDYKGKRYVFVRSTASLKTVEFMEYIDRIKVFAAQELGVRIPEPGEVAFR